MITPESTRQCLVVAALAAAAACSSASADRLFDAFSDTSRNTTLWTEYESTTASGCKVREYGGKLRFEGSVVAGSASYRFTKRFDWNDGFVVDWTQLSTISTPTASTRSGRAGIALGWGSFAPTGGYYDGINVEVIRSSSARRLVLSVRKGGAVVDSAYCAIGTAESTYRLVFSTGFGTSLEVYVDGASAPALSIDGLDAIFASRASTGISAALLAWSTSGVTMDCRMDNFKIWGDQFDDSDDRLADDSDTPDDEDDEDGYDDYEDGEDEGEDDAPRSVTVAQFNRALSVASALAPHPTLEAEVDRVGSSSLVAVLKWNASTSRLVEVRVNAVTGAVVATRIWVPSASQRANYQDEIDALADVVLQGPDAVSLLVGGDETVAELELESEDSGPVWKVKFVDSSGDEDESEIEAN